MSSVLPGDVYTQVCVCLHLFLLCQFFISHSKRVYCASQICVQYSKITQIQRSIGEKGKEKHKVGSEMRLVRKCRLWNPTTSYRCHKFSLCSLAVIPKMEIQFSGRKIKLYQLLKLPKSAWSHNLGEWCITMTQFVRNFLRLTNGPATLNKQKSLAGSSLTFPGWKSWFPNVLDGSITSHSR